MISFTIKKSTLLYILALVFCVVLQSQVALASDKYGGGSSGGGSSSGKFTLKIEYSQSLVIGVVSGTYGTETLDPNFDCGTGPPDMVIAMNAGLYAYASWRSVVTYLYHHSGVV